MEICWRFYLVTSQLKCCEERERQSEIWREFVHAWVLKYFVCA